MAAAGRVAVALALFAVLAGCSTQNAFTRSIDEYVPIITQFGVYKLDINQGNYLSQDMVDKLKVGMTPGGFLNGMESVIPRLEMKSLQL